MLPHYIDELQQYLLQEEANRTAFYENVTNDEKAEFINGDVIRFSPARDKHTVIVYNISSTFIRFARKNKAEVVRGKKSLVREII